MDTSNFRPELHVAQQTRRDKMRIQPDSKPSVNNLGVFTDMSLDQISDLRHGNACYNSSGLCAEMLGFSSNSQEVLAQKDGLSLHQEPVKWAAEASSFPNFSHPVSNSTTAVNCDPQHFGSWKSIGSQTSHGWAPDRCPTFVGESFFGSPLKNINSSTLDVKPYVGCQELSSSIADSDLSGKKQFGDMHCSSSFYSNSVRGVGSGSSNVQSFGQEMDTGKQKGSFEDSCDHVPLVDGGGELVLLPAYADQLCLKSASDLIIAGPAPAEASRSVANENSNTQALSLSLSSIPSPKLHSSQIEHGKDSLTNSLHSKIGCVESNAQQYGSWKMPEPDFLPLNPLLLTGGNFIGNGRQDFIGTSAFTHRNPGPLGPFTGYATILKSSRFLRPSQLLLDEICTEARLKDVENCAELDRDSEVVRVSCGFNSVAGPDIEVVADNSGPSSFKFNGSNVTSWQPESMNTGSTSWQPESMNTGSTESYQPENLQKKAKLLCMQDEVCKRYRQYHQQMQMIVSSFDTVAGLSAATPYISLTIKTVSKHFRCLKNALTNQLKLIRNVLGEDLSSPTAGTSSSKGQDASASLMLKLFDQTIQKQKGEANPGMFDNQHVWRPQRGLPERAVSILRAWLFDHFLHPYPTDTDKLMLASQTGLTRNQVSNWFINARVRVWKPMVEEIHMLETKSAVEETGSSTSKTDGKHGTEDPGRSENDNCSIRLNVNAVSDMLSPDCSSVIPPKYLLDRLNLTMWNQDKFSRAEYDNAGGVDESLVSCVPSLHGGLDIGGLGAVSLTLGLRQSAEGSQRQPQLQQERRMRQYFGGQMVRDFVG